MATACIALGSNLGDRRRHLDEALEQLRQRPGVTVERVSTYHETRPVGGPVGQEPYLNAAAVLQTALPPRELLEVLLNLEEQLGRVRAGRHGPRTVDLDLLLYDQVVVDEPGLIVPHPRMHLRRFVLEPLAEVAATVVHPILGRTIAELLASLPVVGSVSRELTGLRAVVTGSSSGIGRAIALEFAAAGADVMIHGRRSRATVEEVAQQAQAFQVDALTALADLRDHQEALRLVDVAWQAWGRVDVWVNNAGADTLTGDAAKWDFDRKLGELLAVDVGATVWLSREVGRRMRAAGSGCLLNIGWDQADTGMEGDSGQLFGLTKGAVMAFTKSLALSLAPEVRVNCLAPGWIQTAWGETASTSWQDRVLRETPLRRWGRPEDVAAAARWLASPAAAYITGQVVRVNGGAVR
jgi:2-amino-4-hydroxy-6-hydroxymethyldihydropteridine diphosphokinase